jgi:hypothetical protein
MLFSDFIDHLLFFSVGRYVHPHLPAFRSYRHRLVAHPPHHVERLRRTAAQRQLLDISLDASFHRHAQFLLDRKEPVRRTQTLQPLVRPLVVVIFQPPADPFPRLLEIRELRPHQELLPDRLPEPLDLAQGHRVMRTAADMVDPVFFHLPHERRPPAPADILSSVVRQHLPRHPIRPDTAPVHLQHILRGLAPEYLEPRDVPGMIVNESDQVGIRPAQLERKDIALPQLVRGGPLEKTRLRRVARGFPLRRRDQLLPVQRPPHRLTAHRQEKHPLEKVGHFLHTVIEMFPLDGHDCRVNSRRGLRAAL